MLPSRYRQSDKLRLDSRSKTLLIREWLEQVISDSSYQRLALKEVPQSIILMFQWYDVMYNGFYPLYFYLKRGTIPSPDWDPREDPDCAEWIATLSHRFFCEYIKRRGDVDTYESDGLLVTNDRRIQQPERAWKSLEAGDEENKASFLPCTIGEHREIQFGESVVSVRYI